MLPRALRGGSERRTKRSSPQANAGQRAAGRCMETLPHLVMPKQEANPKTIYIYIYIYIYMDKLSCMKKSLFCTIGAEGANYVCFQEPKPTLKHVNLQCRDKTRRFRLRAFLYDPALHYRRFIALHCGCAELCSVVFYSSLLQHTPIILYYTILYYTIHYHLSFVVTMSLWGCAHLGSEARRPFPEPLRVP